MPAPSPLLLVVADATVGERLSSAIDGETRSVVGPAAALEALRGDAFHAVVVAHTDGGVDAAELIAAVRASGDETPIVALVDRAAETVEDAVFDAGGDACLYATHTSPRRLLVAVRRAAGARAMAVENRRLRAAERRRLTQDRDDAERLLSDQRSLVEELEELPTAGAEPTGADDEPVAERYEALLRAYVVMGVGSLAGDIGRLAERLVAEEYTGPRLMELHLEVVGRLVDSLGARGGRHVLARADLLALEVMVHLAEAYRRRYVAAGAGEATSDPGRGAPLDSADEARRLAPWVDRFAA